MFDVHSWINIKSEWSQSMIETWKGQAVFFALFTIVSLLFGGGAYLINSVYWRLGVGFAALIVATFIAVTVACLVWIIVGSIWSRITPEKYRIETYAEINPIKVEIGARIGFTLLWLVLVYLTYTMPETGIVLDPVSPTPTIVGLSDILFAIVVIMGGFLIGSWYKQYQHIRLARESDGVA